MGIVFLLLLLAQFEPEPRFGAPASLSEWPYGSYREKRLSPRQAPGRSLLPLSPKRTQVRLKSLLYIVWLTPDPLRTHGRPSGQECRLRLKRP